ncbi:hypothetical protein ACLB1G_21890 [Oxalobacteraceae bacterium A2-2]
MKLIAKQDFKWAHRGVQVEEFSAGQEIETEDEDLIKVAREEGWAEEVGAKGAKAKKLANDGEHE